MQLMQARVEYIQTVKDSMVDMDVDGNEIKFFSSKFLVQKYLKLSDADLKLNDKLKSEEIEELPDKNQLILVYCRSGRRSKIAAQDLTDLGYTNVKEFGGIIDWQYEIVK